MCVIYSGVGINYCYEFCFCYRQKESSERVGGEQRGAQTVQRHYSLHGKLCCYILCWEWKYFWLVSFCVHYISWKQCAVMQFVFVFHQIASFPLGTVKLKLMFLCILLLNGCIMVMIFCCCCCCFVFTFFLNLLLM